MNKPLRLLAVAALAALVAVAPAHADDVSDAINSAKEAYDAGNLSEAIQSLDYASQLVRQAKSAEVVKLLPEAPDGWEAEEGEDTSAATAIMGGMVSAQRNYTRDDSQVTIQIQSDSPMLQSFGMMFTNPMMLTASGAKLENVKGQKLAVTYRAGDKAGDVKAIIDNRYLISIEGTEISRDDLMAFARAVDYGKIGALK